MASKKQRQFEDQALGTNCRGACQECPFEPVRTFGAIKGKIEHLKVTYKKEKAGPKEQIGGEGSNWEWFQRLEVLLAKTAKGDGVFGGVDTGVYIHASSNASIQGKSFVAKETPGREYRVIY